MFNYSKFRGDPSVADPLISYKDGQVTFGHSKSEPNSWNHSQPLPIEKPDDLIDFFMENSPACQIGNISTLFETDNLVVSTRIGNKELFCHGMGL